MFNVTGKSTAENCTECGIVNDEKVREINSLSVSSQPRNDSAGEMMYGMVALAIILLLIMFALMYWSMHDCCFDVNKCMSKFCHVCCIWRERRSVDNRKIQFQDSAIEVHMFYPSSETGSGNSVNQPTIDESEGHYFSGASLS